MAGIIVRNGLPSPLSSARSPTLSVSSTSNSLPTPRSHPLIAGSSKESALINYIDTRIRRIDARYAKKFSSDHNDSSKDTGYVDFDQVVEDIDPILDVIWVSNTPALQVPYLLTLAGDVCSFMPSFAFSLSVFGLTAKLDTAFATIIEASDNSQATSHRISMTEKVRIKSLIEETRLVARKTASSSGHDTQLQDMSLDETDDDTEEEFIDLSEATNLSRADDRTISLNLAKVYERTLNLLGDALGNLPTYTALTNDDVPMEDGETIEL